RTGWIRRPGGLDDRQLAAVPQRFERLKRRMQAESSVEIDSPVWLPGRWHRNRRAPIVVAGFEEWHDDVEAVGGSTLQDPHQDFPAAALLGRRAHEPRRRHADTRGRYCG